MVFDVELLACLELGHEPDRYAEARRCYQDWRHSGALLGKGIALKLKGDKAAAREWFQKAEDADPRSDAGREARRHLDNL